MSKTDTTTRNIKAVYPLTPLQQGLLFHDLYSSGTDYICQTAFEVAGALDASALIAAWNAAVARHDILRTAFVWQRLEQPKQVVAIACAIPTEMLDWTHDAPEEQEHRWEEFLLSDRARGFTLSEAPLMRLTLVQFGAESCRFVWTRHHLLLDGWSTANVLQEVLGHYQAAATGRPPVALARPRPYREYVNWIQAKDATAATEYWRGLLAGFTSPTPLPEAAAGLGRDNAAHGFSEQSRLLSASLTESLQLFCHRNRLTLNTVFQATWALILSCYGGSDDVVFGQTVSGRPASLPGVSEMVGLFINTLPVRVRVPKLSPFVDWLADLQLAQADQGEFDYSSLVSVQGASDVPPGIPLFESLLVFENYPIDATLAKQFDSLGAGGIRLKPLGTYERSHYPLAITVVPQAEIQVRAAYERPRFSEEAMARLLGRWSQLLEQVVLTPGLRVFELSLLSDAERAHLLTQSISGPRAEFQPVDCVHQLFERQVAATPDAVALVLDDQVLTYAALNSRANKLAHYLRNLGVGAEVRVGLLVSRSPDMVIGLLGILKAGGAYLPLDPDYPPERLAYIMEDARIQLVVTHEDLASSRLLVVDPPDTGSGPGPGAMAVALDSHAAPEQQTVNQESRDPVGRSDSAWLSRATAMAPGPGQRQTAVGGGNARNQLQLVCIDRDWPTISQQPDANPSAAATAQNLAYVIYTSGSTGKPKGSLVTHANVVRLFYATQNNFQFGPTDVWTLFHSIAFDFSVWEVWGPLLHGGVLQIIPYIVSRTPQDFWNLVVSRQVTVLNQTPSAFRMLQQVALESPPEALALRTVIFGGEALDLGSLADWIAQPHLAPVSLVNMYGITETTVHVTYRALTATDIASNSGSLIGAAIDDLSLYVLNQFGQLVPSGAPGELYVGGGGLARGYLDRPGLMAERFVPHPFSAHPGERLYRTGDLARRLENGDLEYLGRVDEQVKIRGFRIELGEIESALSQHPAVSAAVVTVREDTPGDKRLVAYVVAHGDARGADGGAVRIDPGQLLAHLKSGLPEYMLPAAFVFLDSLPLTSHGKIDRKSLPAPDYDTPGTANQEARNPVEELVAQIWSDLLRVERVGRDSNFFTLGGHSLLATQVASRIRTVFGIQLPLRVLFETPTLSEFAREVNHALSGGGEAPPPSITPAGRENPLPLSYSQERLWFLDQLVPDHAFYNTPVAVRLTGMFNVQAMEDTLNEIARRHESLRTHFELLDGDPVQMIDPASPRALEVTDLSGLAEAEREETALRLAHEEAQRPFDLGRGPLFRALVLRLGDAEHALLITMHHITSDGWSIGVLIHEVAALYNAFAAGQPSPLPELPVQYADFAVWQRNYLQGDVLDRQLGYWKERLADLTPLHLPADRPRTSVQMHSGAIESFRLPAELSERLWALSRNSGVTPFMALLAAFQVLLQRYSGQLDIAVGAPIANRNRSEIEALIGFFVNTLVLRTDLSGAPTFRALLGRVRETALGAYAHQDLPFEKLVEQVQPERNMSVNPLVQVAFVVQNAPADAIALAGLEVSHLRVDPGVSRFDMEMHVTPQAGGEAIGVLVYDSDLFDADRMRRMIGHYVHLLEGIAAAPERPISELSLLTDAERHQLLVAWNGPVDAGARAKCLHELFEEQAARTPNAVAVERNGRRMTYAELNSWANQIARHLSGLGSGPERLVGVCLARGIDMVAALLGVLKTGAAYVPLDPDYPAERLAYLQDDAGARLLVTQESLLAGFPRSAGQVAVCLDRDRDEIARSSTENLAPRAYPENLAYVIYTSGSTGAPKGVALTHRSAVAFVTWAHGRFSKAELACVLAGTSICFDLSIFEIFVTLASGGRVVIAVNALELPALPASLGITLINTVPSAIAELVRLNAIPDTVRVINLAGEPLAPQLVDRLYARPWIEKVHDLYGPSEDTTYSTFALRERGGMATIGAPLSNTQVYILDSAMDPMPIGVPGELYIGGSGLARGYHGRPALTAEKFTPDPYSAVPGQRLYRTGDLARWMANGTLEYLGRVDHQVKVRGFRIELGEIEAVLQDHQEVEEVVVIAKDDDGHDKRLVAYVVAGTESREARDRAATQVSDWKTTYDAIYSRESVGDDPTFNTVGWDSGVTGKAIPAEEMHAWTDSTVERIMALRPENVLEIGCGTGLLLWRIAPHCARYVGLDYSQVVIDRLTERIAETAAPTIAAPLSSDSESGPGAMAVALDSHAASDSQTGIAHGADQESGPGAMAVALDSHAASDSQTGIAHDTDLVGRPAAIADLSTKVTLLRRDADNLEGFADQSFDTVIINSVVQYFPDAAYLNLVIEQALRVVKPGGSVFIGDVRSLPLLPAFHTWVQRNAMPVERDPAAFWGRVRNLVVSEKELVVAPRFFTELEERFPNITRVTARPKRGRHRNEMTCYRYDVTLHIGEGSPVSDIASPRWLDWRDERLTPLLLAQRLRESAPEILCVANVPNARVANDSRLVGLLSDGVSDAARLTQALASEIGVEPDDIWQIGEDLGYTVDLSWLAGRPDGAFDVVMRRAGGNADAFDSASVFESLARGQAAKSDRLTNTPSLAWAVHDLVPELRKHVKDRLPAYMVPSVFVILDALPLTPNGKVDRKALPAPRFEHTEGYVAPRLPVEETLAQIWAAVLGLDRVGVNDNFFEIGGDSILSIQIVSRANQAGILLTPRMMFEAQTIAELSMVCGTALEPEADQGPVTGPVLITPIQHWFFEQKLAAPHHFNQSVLLECGPELDLTIIRTAVERLFAHHDALRMRYVSTPDGWRQENAGIEPDNPALFAVEDLSHYADTALRDSAMERACEALQSGFDLENGPLIKVRCFVLGADVPVRLLIAAHHLVIDGVSWRILLEDLELACGQLLAARPIALPAKSTSFQAWASHLDDYARSEQMRAEEPYWSGLPWGAVRPLSHDVERTGDLAGLNTVAAQRSVTEVLSIEQTKALLQEAPEAYHTQINDILLAALAATLCRWTGLEYALVALEGHGREDLFESVPGARGVNVSRTVGWFTSLFPVFLHWTPEMEIGDSLIATKEMLRAIPARGIGYGLLRYLADWSGASPGHIRGTDTARPSRAMDVAPGPSEQAADEAYGGTDTARPSRAMDVAPGSSEQAAGEAAGGPDTARPSQAMGVAPGPEGLATNTSLIPDPEVSFNYLGQVDQLLPEGSLFRIASGNSGSPHGADNERPHLLDISAIILRGQLRITWTYCDAMHSDATVQGLVNDYVAQLQGLIAHCTSPGVGAYTPSDFPYAQLNSAQLASVISGLNGRTPEAIYPLSQMQQGMLFHSLYAPGSGEYVNQALYSLRGELDVPAFLGAWRHVMDQNDILRAAFFWDGLPGPMQVVCRDVEIPLEREDWSGRSPEEQERGFDELLKRDAEAGFDLSQGPAMRLRVIQLGQGHSRVLWTHHHIILDGWCQPVLFREVLACYEAIVNGAQCPDKRPRPYFEFIQWLYQQDLDRAETYWRWNLAGFSSPTPLPDTGMRPSQADRNSAGIDQNGEELVSLSGELSRACAAAAQRLQVTPNTLMLGAWSLLLGRYSGLDDVLVGATVSGRPPVIPGIETMIGLFINTLPVRVHIDGNRTVSNWLQGLQAEQAERSDYEYSSLTAVQGWSEVSRDVPLFECLFVFENYPVDPNQPPKIEVAGGLTIDHIDFRQPTSYPLSVCIIPGSRLVLRFGYQRARYTREAIERISTHYQYLLSQIVADTEARLDALTLLTREERAQILVGWNDTEAALPLDKCLHELFEDQVKRTPNAIAVTCGDDRLTYGELNARSNQLAHHLRSLGVGPDERVGLAIRRSFEMVVAVLAVLKAGGAYVPLDPEYPPERLAYMLSDAAARVLITQSSLRAMLPETTARVLVFDGMADIPAGQSSENPAPSACPDNLAYLIYTSGSTGRPKGVAMQHLPLVNLITWQTGRWTLGGPAKTLQFCSLSFDASFNESFSTWLTGGTLALISEDLQRDFVSLSRHITANEIEWLFPPYAALQHIAEFSCADAVYPTSLRRVMSTAEQLQVTQPIIQFFANLPDCVLHTEYGPSETHVVTTSTLTGSPESWPARPPIGRPIANTQIYLLDKDMNPVPSGVIGGLYIGGVSLARGYFNKPDLTAERFIPDPYSAVPGARLYATGDMARYAWDGEITFLGRIDHQIKIRGFRVELGEIESTLTRLDAVKEAIVVTREYAPGDTRIVAYVVFEEDNSLELRDLRQVLSQSLPAYMIPSALVVLPVLPLNPNGKVDRAKLPPPDFANAELAASYAPPRTPAEEVLCEILMQVLAVSRVGINDSFFDLGGHSLLAMQLVSRVHEVFQIEVPFRALFENPTVAGLAAVLAELWGSADIVDTIAGIYKDVNQESVTEAA